MAYRRDGTALKVHLVERRIRLRVALHDRGADRIHLAFCREVIWFPGLCHWDKFGSSVCRLILGYLAGLAFGAYLIRDHCEAKGAAPAFLLGIAILLSSAFGFLVLPVAGLAATSGFAWFVGSMLLGVFLQTAIAGSAFPLICYLGVAPGRQTGVGVSYLYVANILGSVTGTLTTGFVLMDLMSIAHISLGLTVLGALTALAVVFGAGAEIVRSRQIVIASIAASVVAASCITLGPLFDSFYERITYKANFAANQKFVDVVENKHGVVGSLCHRHSLWWRHV